MRKFRFRMQRLLDLEERRERQARRAFAHEAAVEAELSERVSAWERSRETCLQGDVARALGDALARGFAHRAVAAAPELGRRRAATDAARTTWHDRRTAVRALEAVRDRRLAVWQAGWLAAEQAELEDRCRRPASADAIGGWSK